VETGLLTLEGTENGHQTYAHPVRRAGKKTKSIALNGGLNCSLGRSCKVQLTHENIWRKIIKRNEKFVLKPTFYLKWEKIRISAVNEDSL
jgi:hypothetical protein